MGIVFYLKKKMKLVLTIILTNFVSITAQKVAFPLIDVDRDRDEAFVRLSAAEESEDLSVRILSPSTGRCGLQLKDWAEVRLRTFAPGVKIMPQLIDGYKFGHAEQEFEVGKHNIKPLNQAIVGMCRGETRRVGIRLGHMGKIYYEITLEGFRRASPTSKNRYRHTEL